jgi:four helix bundle protein
MNKVYFDHEKLRVYQYSLEFVCWCHEISEKIPKKMSVSDQLDRSSTSICLNIAEGNGKFSPKDRSRFLEISRASALESASCLDVLVAKKLLTLEEIQKGKELLLAIVPMLTGMTFSLSK